MGIALAIEAGLSAIEKLAGVVSKWIVIGRQTKELTDEQAAAYTKRQEAAFASPAWQPDKK